MSAGQLLRASDRFLRLLCALAIAVVATFHVCDTAAAGRMADVVIGAASDSSDTPSSPSVVEKCHLCAVVSLPALPASDPVILVVRAIPAGTTLQVTSFDQPAVGPPPRA